MFIIGSITFILSMAVITSILIITSKKDSDDEIVAVDTREHLLQASEKIVE